MLKIESLTSKVNLLPRSSIKNYINYCVILLKNQLGKYSSIQHIKQNEENINAYKNIDHLEELKNISVLDKNTLTKQDIKYAEKCIIEGKLFSEHTAAGEATRLGLGSKYLINIKNDLSIEKIAQLMSKEKQCPVSTKEVLRQAGCSVEKLLPLSLGTRHMMQFSFDIAKLARKYAYDPQDILDKQKMLIVVNSSNVEKIIQNFQAHNFFNFKKENVMFMVQQHFHGITLKNNEFIYDTSTPTRLHNHGQMVIQQTMNDQIFHINENNRKHYLKSYEFSNILQQMEDKVSYNIEDLSYLTGSIDYESLAFALKKGKQGCEMLMEIVGNNPENPQKGGMAVFDKILGKNVMIEGFQLKGIENHEIKYLNKNFNHYPKPWIYWNVLKEKGLNMPICVKGDCIYFQPVQGDINFLVNTEFFRRKELKTIESWKSPATTPLAIKNMRKQDLQPGFNDYAEYIDAEIFFPKAS